MVGVLVSPLVELETRLGVAVTSRSKDMLVAVLDELASLKETETQRLWSRLEGEFSKDDTSWLKETLKSLNPDEEYFDSVEPLTSDEVLLRQAIEARLNTFFNSFVERGNDLATLRNKRLYREDYNSWESYCRIHLGWSKTHADRLIKASEVCSTLTPIGTTFVLPSNEYVARELAKIKQVDTRNEVWKLALQESADKPVTSHTIKRVKEQLGGNKTPTQIVEEEPFSVGELVTIKSKSPSYNNHWGIIDSIIGNRYKVTIGVETIAFEADELLELTDSNLNTCLKVIKLSQSPHKQIQILASTFFAYTSLEDWQIDLLDYIEELNNVFVI